MSVEITKGHGTQIAAKDSTGGAVQVVTDPALSGGVLDQILAELKRMNLILCAIGRLNISHYENTKL